MIILYFLLSGFTVIGHRGEPLTAPEESFASFDAAASSGADAIELDVHLSADGVPIVQHDDNLLRMTGMPLTIAQAPCAKIQTYHTRNGEPVHTLAEVLDRYRNTSLNFLIEIKRPKGTLEDALENAVTEVVASRGVTSRVSYQSFSMKSLRALKASVPQNPRFFIAGSLKRINYAVLQDVTGVNLKKTLVSPELLSSLHALKKQVYVWDELDEDYEKWRWLSNDAIDGIITNDVRSAREYADLHAESAVRKRRFEAQNTSATAATLYYNPYDNSVRKETIAPGSILTVRKQVNVNGRWYDEVGENRFVQNTTMTALGPAGWANKLVGKTVSTRALGLWRTNLTTPTHVAPRKTAAVAQIIVNNSPQTITAVSYHNKHLWIKTEAGWLPEGALNFPIFSGENFFGQGPDALTKPAFSLLELPKPQANNK